ncbi:MAG: FMN-binding protein [Gemmatimonadota bacterium]
MFLPLAVAPVAAPAQVLLTQEEALRLVFPEPAEIERRTAYLDAERLAELEEASGTEQPSTIITYYVGREGDRPLGVAYFDAHRVRTLPEVLMVHVEPDGRVGRIEVLRFAEPQEYLAPAGWLDRFEGRRLDGDLDDRNAVAGITGATLTSRAIEQAVRRTLALHAWLDPLSTDSGDGTQ